MKAETWTEISKTVRTVVIQSYNQAAPESASVASWEYQLTSERKSSYSYYWSLSPVLHLSLSLFYLSLSLPVCLPLLPLPLLPLNLSVSPLICRASRYFSFFLSASPSFFLCPSLSVFLRMPCMVFEEYNPLPHPPPLRKPWADTPGSVRPKRSPTVR